MLFRVLSPNTLEKVEELLVVSIPMNCVYLPNSDLMAFRELVLNLVKMRISFAYIKWMIEVSLFTLYIHPPIPYLSLYNLAYSRYIHHHRIGGKKGSPWSLSDSFVVLQAIIKKEEVKMHLTREFEFQASFFMRRIGDHALERVRRLPSCAGTG